MRPVRAAGRAERSCVLVGARASGKTVLGRALARRLGWPFVDADREVARRTGRGPRRWIQEEGLAAFRRVEEEVTLSVLEGPGPFVAALGGGAVESARIRRALRRFPRVVWLVASVEVLACRLQERPRGRPSLTGAEPHREVAEVLRRRRPLYRQVARCTLNTSRGNVEEWLQRLLARLRLPP